METLDIPRQHPKKVRDLHLKPTRGEVILYNTLTRLTHLYLGDELHFLQT